MAMDLDMFPQRLVLAGRCERHVSVWAQFIELRPVQKAGILRFADQIVGLIIRRQGYAGLDLCHVCLDVRSAQLASHRDTMIAIANKVGFADLVHFDGRQALKVGEPGLDPGPSFLISVFPGQKAACKVSVASNTANNGIERDLFQSLVTPALGLEHITHVFVWQQIGRLATQLSQELLSTRLVARPPEVTHGRQVPQLEPPSLDSPHAMVTESMAMIPHPGWGAKFRHKRPAHPGGEQVGCYSGARF